MMIEKPMGGFKNDEWWCYFHVLMSMVMVHTEYQGIDCCEGHLCAYALLTSD